MQARPPRLNGGVTLIELLVTLSIIAIVLTLGVSGFRYLIVNTKMTNAANSLIGHLQFARSEAVKRDTEVSLCPSTDGASCLASSGGSWEIGYIVRVDSTGEVLRRVDGAEMASLTVTKSGVATRIAFKPDGSAGGFACTLTICDTGDSSNKRGVVVSNVGRVRVSDYASGGSALTCP
jgi:type IV fimbrial biogenesis protein FimT